MVKMNCIKFFSVFWVLVSLATAFAEYQCGIRKHSLASLISYGSIVEEGQWPWHVAIIHIFENETKYACGGSLIDERHILTAAHCAVNKLTGYPMSIDSVRLHLGQTDRSKTEKNLQVRDVLSIHVHPNFETHRNDIALIKLKSPVKFTMFVIPICLHTINHNDLRDMEGQRGFITGWGMTQNGTLSNRLRSASLPVVNITQCLENDWRTFGGLLNSNVFCAGELNGTSPGTGDSGGGMYFSEGDRWVLRGIVSFAKMKDTGFDVDFSKYAVFTNVQRFLTWIREKTENWSSNPSVGGVTKRISEKECDRFKNLARKRNDGTCWNNRYPQTVPVVNHDGIDVCTGVFLTEEHVLTTCYCKEFENPKMVRIRGIGFVNISKSVCHPAYDNSKHYNDIAVIEIASPIELSHNIIPACLATKRTENLYDTLLSTGFRYMFSKNTDVSKILAELFESSGNRVVAAERCNERRFIELLPSQLCIINNDNIKNNINNTRSAKTRVLGTSGTVLQTFNTQTCLFTVIGVLGSYNHFDDIPNVFSRVAHHQTWIEETVWGVPVVSETTTIALEEPMPNKRISEKECERFKLFARKRIDGTCMNDRNPNVVPLIDGHARYVCSGIFVNENHVLTRCSCLEVFKPVAVRIDKYATIKILMSSCYKPENSMYQHNIAIVKLVSAVQFSYQTIPACLASDWIVSPSDTLLITGYKRNNEEDDYIKLIKIGVHQVPEKCNRDTRRVSNDSNIVPHQSCVEINKLTLPDGQYFGGPLQTVNNRSCMFRVIALSVVIEETTANGVQVLDFSHLAPYIDWIEKIAWATSLQQTTLQPERNNKP